MTFGWWWDVPYKCGHSVFTFLFFASALHCFRLWQAILQRWNLSLLVYWKTREHIEFATPTHSPTSLKVSGWNSKGANHFTYKHRSQGLQSPLNSMFGHDLYFPIINPEDNSTDIVWDRSKHKKVDFKITKWIFIWFYVSISITINIKKNW